MTPRFSIRDILWLTVLVTILLLWWIDHRQLGTRNRFTVETIRSSDGEPTVLRDNDHSDVILIRTETGWEVAVPPGEKIPIFKPE